MLKDMTERDINMYYSNSYTITEDGVPVIISRINKPTKNSAVCHCVVPYHNEWGEEIKSFNIDKLVLKYPQTLGYYNANKLVYATRYVRRSIQRLITEDNTVIINVNNMRLSKSPNIIKQIYNPVYPSVSNAITSILNAKTSAIALNHNYCLKYSYSLDSLILYYKQIHIGYYRGDGMFLLDKNMADYIDDINKTFNGELNVSI